MHGEGAWENPVQDQKETRGLFTVDYPREMDDHDIKIRMYMISQMMFGGFAQYSRIERIYLDRDHIYIVLDIWVLQCKVLERSLGEPKAIRKERFKL